MTLPTSARKRSKSARNASSLARMSSLTVSSFMAIFGVRNWGERSTRSSRDTTSSRERRTTVPRGGRNVFGPSRLLFNPPAPQTGCTQPNSQAIHFPAYSAGCMSGLFRTIECRPPLPRLAADRQQVRLRPHVHPAVSNRRRAAAQLAQLRPPQLLELLVGGQADDRTLRIDAENLIRGSHWRTKKRRPDPRFEPHYVAGRRVDARYVPLAVLEQKHQIALADRRRHIRCVLLDAIFFLRLFSRLHGHQIMPAAARASCSKYQPRDIQRTTDRTHRQNPRRPVFLPCFRIESEQALRLCVAKQLVLSRFVLSHCAHRIRRGVDLAVRPPTRLAATLLDRDDEALLRLPRIGPFRILLRAVNHHEVLIEHRRGAEAVLADPVAEISRP